MFFCWQAPLFLFSIGRFQPTTTQWMTGKLVSFRTCSTRQVLLLLGLTKRDEDCGTHWVRNYHQWEGHPARVGCAFESWLILSGIRWSRSPSHPTGSRWRGFECWPKALFWHFAKTKTSSKTKVKGKTKTKGNTRSGTKQGIQLANWCWVANDQSWAFISLVACRDWRLHPDQAIGCKRQLTCTLRGSFPTKKIMEQIGEDIFIFFSGLLDPD